MDDPIPDPAALVLGHLAELRGIPEEDWWHGSVADLAHRLHRIRAMREFLHEMEQEIEENLAASMETDVIDIPGLGRSRRSETTRSTWADDSAAERLRDDLASAVAREVALDIATGEMDPMKRNVAMHTMRAAYEAIPSFSSVKTAGRKRFGIAIGDYRSFDTGYTVKIEAVEDE